MYQNRANSYGRSVDNALSGRELEAHVLMKSAARLQAIADAWDPSAKPALEEALTTNRKLWTILASSIVDEENPLPLPLKQSLLSLSDFVFRRTIQLTVDPKPEAIRVLVEINANIAAGLRGRA